MKDLKISTKLLGAQIAILEIGGALDAHTHTALEEKLRHLLRRGRVKIVAELSQLEYISSAGAGLFVGAAAKAREKGGDIVFLDPQPQVREVFEMLGLAQIFEIAEDRETALHALR
jgi:anti-sigma B factor antagonist